MNVMDIQSIKEEIHNYSVSNEEELEGYRMRFISRKSILGDLFAQMKNVPAEERKAYGQQINELKEAANEKFQELIHSLEEQLKRRSAKNTRTLASASARCVRWYSSAQRATRAEIIRIFERIGFNVSNGPEIEDDWHNFTALNFPENHPAREMQDTFFAGKESRYCPAYPHLFGAGTRHGRTNSRLFVRFLQAACTVTKLFRPGPIVFSTR